MVVSGEHDPDLSGGRVAHRVEMLQPNRSFWSFLSKISIQRAFPYAPKAYVEAMYALAIQINAAPPRTPITVVWNTVLPHFDSTSDPYQDECHLVAFSSALFSPEEYGSFTAWRIDTRPWVGTEDMIVYAVPGMAFFAMTGEYGAGEDGINWASKHNMGKWFRQVIPAGSQIDLLRQEIRRYCIRHVKETEHISDWRITLSSTGFHFDPLDSVGNPLENAKEFVKLEGFTPLFQHKGIQDTLLLDTNIVVCAEELAACVINNAQAQAPDIHAAEQAANIVVCAEEPAYFDLFNAQAQADIHANGEEKATCFQRATDSTESLNDPASPAGSSPWKPASLPFTYFDTYYRFTGRWFRQITPLGIRNARSLGTNAIPKALRLAHVLGAPGPMPQAAPRLFQRAAEVALGVSFNAQSQAPDIPGASSRVFLSRHTVSLQAKSKAPDILSLRAYTEELLASLNAQTQAPDDPSQTFSSDFLLLSLRAYMEQLSASFNAQDQAPDDLHTQDRQCDQCIFVENSHNCRQELSRLHTHQDVSHFSLQQVSLVRAQELFNRLLTFPYQGFSRIEFHVYCLWIIPVVSQDVDCFSSVGLGFSWTFVVIIFNDQHGSTLFVSMYVSFA